MLKSVSRSRSLVGRVLEPRGAVSWRERLVPAMTRITPLSWAPGRYEAERIQYFHARMEFFYWPFLRRRSADPRVLPAAAGDGHGRRGGDERESDAHAWAVGTAAAGGHDPRDGTSNWGGLVWAGPARYPAAAYGRADELYNPRGHGAGRRGKDSATHGRSGAGREHWDGVAAGRADSELGARRRTDGTS